VNTLGEKMETVTRLAERQAGKVARPANGADLRTHRLLWHAGAAAVMVTDRP